MRADVICLDRMVIEQLLSIATFINIQKCCNIECISLLRPLVLPCLLTGVILDIKARSIGMAGKENTPDADAEK